MGLKKGDRVGMWGPNCMEWFLMQYATARAGLIMVYFQLMFTKFVAHVLTFSDIGMRELSYINIIFNQLNLSHFPDGTKKYLSISPILA